MFFLLFLFLALPLAAVLSEAFKHGVGAYIDALGDRETLSAIRLTLLTAAVAVPLNTIFGLAAAWAIAKFEFRGRALMTTLLDIPFAVSPVVAGLMFILLFGVHSPLGGGLESLGIKVVFAVPGVILATIFVTFPFVAREVIPLMRAQGTEEEQSAVILGAGGWRIFFRVTLPNIKWGLLYGVILCNARAMGEFGAASVLSGHLRGITVTMPLQIEILASDYQGAAAFAVASLLALLALVTLVVKTIAEWSRERTLKRLTAHEQSQTAQEESCSGTIRPEQIHAKRPHIPLKVEISGVSKSFGGSAVLNEVSINIVEGEMMVLLGPSGCGKTTLLRLIAGLEAPDGGTLVFPGAETGQSRPVGFIFQSYALFPHLTVFDNVAFGLTLKRNRTGEKSRNRIRDRVFELLRVVQMDALASRYPAQLSGGQSQRVAMARALAVEPGLLLLDEPFSALDAKIRREMRVWLLKLRQELGLTCIFVTHDQQEALELADRVALMNRGRIEQIGTPRALWQNQASPFVADFLGINRAERG